MRSGWRLVRHYLQGLLMGAADVVPGVSGGTMALIMGVYRPLIDSVGYAAEGAVRLVRGNVAGFREDLAAMSWPLLLPLGAGIVTAILIAAAFVPDIIETYPVQSRAFFFGLISGSLFIPWRRIREHSVRTFAVLAIGAVAGFLLTGFPDAQATDPGPLRIFGSAMIAICAMILPGVSGAFLLLVLGMYERTLDAVHDRDLAYLAIFAAGAVTGLGLFSTVLKALLSRWQDLTMAALVGLMAGSLRALWPYLDDDRGLRGPADGEPVLAVIALVLGGLACVVVLLRLGEDDRTALATRSRSTAGD